MRRTAFRAHWAWGVPPLPTGQPSPWMGPFLSLQALPGLPPSRGQLPPGRVPCLPFPLWGPIFSRHRKRREEQGVPLSPSLSSGAWPVDTASSAPPAHSWSPPPPLPVKAKPRHLSVLCKPPALSESARPQGGPRGRSLGKGSGPSHSDTPQPLRPDSSSLTPLLPPSPETGSSAHLHASSRPVLGGRVWGSLLAAPLLLRWLFPV